MGAGRALGRDGPRGNRRFESGRAGSDKKSNSAQVTAKIRMRDEKLREVRTMLSRVAEQRRAFGTLATKIEEKLLQNLTTSEDKADKAERALVVGAGFGDKLDRIEAERDEARRDAAAAKAAATLKGR